MRKSTLTLMLVLSLLGAALPVLAAPGDVDASFSPTVGTFRIARTEADGSIDTTFTSGTGPNDVVHSVAVQPDGKILIAGGFTSYNGAARNRIARLNADGTLDTSFSVGTGANQRVSSVVVQPDGDILIGGNFTSYNGVSASHVARLNPDGTLDTGFAVGTISGDVFNMALQPDGKIVIAGRFTEVAGEARVQVARLEANGALDATFTQPSGPGSSVFALGIQPDGKILIGGEFTSVAGVPRSRIARLESDGTLDMAFDPGAGFDYGVYGLAIQRLDEKIVVTGNFTRYNGSPITGVARLETTGALDADFKPPVSDFAGHSVVFQSDGKLLASGVSSNVTGTIQNNIIRLDTDGTLDTTYALGVGPNDHVRSAIVQPDGKIVMVGDFTTLEATGANRTVQSIDEQPDGKIVIGGGFSRYDGLSRNRIARLTADGKVDMTFDPGTGANGDVKKVIVQPDGKVLLAGSFSAVNGQARSRIARLESDGSVDMTFGLSLVMARGEVYTMALQPDGKIVIGGSFTTISEFSRNYIARLNADGTIDESFDPGSGFNHHVYEIKLQPDGKMLVGGMFTAFKAETRNHIARLNADGTLDGSFDAGSGPNRQVHAIDLQSDGRILIGGTFENVAGEAERSLARLASSGTLDSTFGPGSGASGTVYDIHVRPDDTIVISGVISSYDGVVRQSIARLNADGALDRSFNPASNPIAPAVYALDVQGDGHVLLGGTFTMAGNLARNNIARMEGNAAVPGLTVSESSGSTAVSETGTTDTFTVTLDAEPASDVTLDIDSSDAGEASVSPSSLTFTPFNWHLPQTVTVTGVNDSDDDDDQTAIITISVIPGSSSDEYDAVAASNVSVTVSDDDSTVSSGGGSSGGGGGGGGGSPMPSITVVSPNGGEVLSAGETRNLLWSYQGPANHMVRLDLSTDGGLTFNDPIVASTAPGTGAYAWTVPDKTSLSAVVRAQLTYFGTPVASDVSNATFLLLGSDAGDLPRSGSGTDTPMTFVPSATINEDKGLTASASGTPPCVSGSLFRIQSISAVYYCGADGKRYVFPNEKVYFSWYADFSDVTVVSDEAMAAIQIGGNVTYKPGSRMIKVESDPKTYLVSRGGRLRHVTTEAVAASLYGTEWNKRIDDLSVSLFPDYTVIEPVTAADLP